MKLAIFAALFLLIFKATHAEEESNLKLEPYAGYYKGSLKSDQIGDGDISSYIIGAKIGIFKEVGFGYGIDYSQGQQGTLGPSTPGGANTQVWNTKQIGLFGNYNISESVGFWLSYMPVYSVEAFGDQRDKIKGDGYGLGVSFKILSFFRMQAEYRIRNLKEIGGQAMTGTNETATIFVSAHFPVNFPYDFGN